MNPARGLEAAPGDLAGLAAGIRSEHEAYQAAIKSGLDHAMACGELLNQAKAKLGHGQWLPWLRQECPKIKTRTAQAYMRLAAHRREIEVAAKNATIAHLTMNAAQGLIARDPKRPATPAVADVAPDTFALVKKPAAEALERERQAKDDGELERDAHVAACLERAHQAHTRPFACRPSYDPEEEDAQNEPARARSLAALHADLRAALVKLSRIVSDMTQKRRESPEEPYPPDETLPGLLAATIKSLHDFAAALQRWHSGAARA
jgi:hypothetical protein